MTTNGANDPPLTGVVITSREIYDAIVRLTGRVDEVISQQSVLATNIITLQAFREDHEIRIRHLEHGRWPIPAVSVVIAVLSLGASIVGWMVQ